jgi:hypothetical protein
MTERNPRAAAEVATRMAEDGASDPAPRRGDPWGWARVLAKIALAIVILGILLLTALYLMLMSSMPKAPTSTVAPVAWASEVIELSPDATVVHGRITLTMVSIPSTGFRVGVNAGVPSVTDQSPAAALSGPAVRVSAEPAPGTNSSCFAPCELQVAEAFDCGSDGCRMVMDVTIELVPTATGSAKPVTLTVSSGLTGTSAKPLASPFDIDLAFEPAAAPRGT